MVSSDMLHRVAPVRTDVSEELGASFIRVTRIGELGTTLAVTSNRRTLRRNTRATRCNIPKTLFFIVAAVKTSNLRYRKVPILCSLPTIFNFPVYSQLIFLFVMYSKHHHGVHEIGQDYLTAYNGYLNQRAHY
jgi:hypothetical protein